MLFHWNKIYYFIAIAFFIFVFLVGMIVYSSGQLKQLPLNLSPQTIESLTNATQCPNLLIRQGGVILLYNTIQPNQPGVNPILFSTLDQYVQYYNSQQAAGVSCNALFLQEETTAQGNQVYRIYKDPLIGNGWTPPIGSLANPLPVVIDPSKPIPYQDAKTSQVQPNIIFDTSNNPFFDPTFNPSGGFDNGGYAAYDPQGQYVGRYTNIDQIHDSTQTLFPDGSPNAADDNWGGVLFTEQVVNSGYYDENNVTILTG